MIPVRTTPSGTILRVHYAAHSLKDGWALPECRRGTPDAEPGPATLDPTEVTCKRCAHLLTKGPSLRTQQRARAKAAGRTDGRRPW